MRFTLPKDTVIAAKVIKDAIDYNEIRRKRFDLLDSYYIGQQAIMEREKPDLLRNNKVMVNHAKYIVDTNVGYLLGNPVEYQAAERYDISPVLDIYKKQTISDLDSEIAKNCAIFGMQYEYVFANEESEPESAELDSRNTIIVYDNTIKHNKLFAVNYRPVFNKPTDTTPDHFDVLVMDAKKISYYTLKDGTLSKYQEDQLHVFEEVPVIEYVNNMDYLGDFEPVISLIDAYNIILSDRVNDREQLVDAILCFYGMHFDATQMDELKLHRALSNIPADGKVEYLTKQISETDVDVLRQNIEQDIHKISMVPNLSDENFVGNASGVAIRYKLLTFEQAVKNKERYFEKGLMERFELYTNFLAVKSQMTKVKPEQVDAVFKRNLPSNDLETSQIINNLTGIVDKELLVAQLSFVKDASETIKIAEQEEKEYLADSQEYAANDFADKNKEKDGDQEKDK